jgi:2,3-dihydroxy-p-cumate/2,3-dihydroxybenzoate 3,4-dioxygenase
MTVRIEQLRYVCLGARDVDTSALFAQHELGLQPVFRCEDEVRLRSDERQYSLIYQRRDPRQQSIGLEVHDEAALQTAADALAARGIEVVRDTQLAAQRNVRHLLAFTTPGGLRVELVVRPQNQGWRFFAARDTGLTGFAAVAARSTAIHADEALWTGVFGARISDWVGDSCYLSFDNAHHRLALHPASRPGVLAVEFGVEGINQVMQQFYRLRDVPDSIAHGPGRRPTSQQLFVSFRGPDDMIYAFVAEGRQVDSNAPTRPRQFPDHTSSYCEWGSDCHIGELNGSEKNSPSRALLRGVPRA